MSWIKVKDGSPKFGVYILFVFDKRVYIGKKIMLSNSPHWESEWPNGVLTFPDQNVEYWMPLPDLP
jgi:hypothetical protein